MTDGQISEIWQRVSGRPFCKGSTADVFAQALLSASKPAVEQTRTLTDDARDAARYRWLRNEHFPTAVNPPLAQVVWKAFDDRHSSDWANMIDGTDLDRAIDEAILAAPREPKPKPTDAEIRAAAIEEAAKACDELETLALEDMALEKDDRFGVYAKKYRLASKRIRSLIAAQPASGETDGT